MTDVDDLVPALRGIAPVEPTAQVVGFARYEGCDDPTDPAEHYYQLHPPIAVDHPDAPPGATSSELRLQWVDGTWKYWLSLPAPGASGLEYTEYCVLNHYGAVPHPDRLLQAVGYRVTQ